ncbi:MAG: hypothetical protein K2P23_12650, partial [Lachnospiraceae bacterium]|nr:hypothetical protein [Lachnospiraceae bacterium]
PPHFPVSPTAPPYLLPLNQEIADVTGIELDCEKGVNLGILNCCQWLGITTAGEAKTLLAQKKDLAVGLAKGILNSENVEILYSTIGLFYLCYAKLVTEYPFEKWIEYFEDNRLGFGEESEEFIEKLNAVYQEMPEDKRE